MPPKFSSETRQKIIFPNYGEDQFRTSPCEVNCPAGNPIQRVHALVQENRIEEALEFLRLRNPFPGITGRVCAHPCEHLCNRNEYDQGLAIRALERFAADQADSNSVARLKRGKKTGKKLAIIGSGPAGMACAYFSALLGHDVAVFESLPVLGGIPRTAIPDFWLPKDIVDREIGKVLALGIKVRTNTTIGRDVAFQEILAEHDACLIAVGAGRDRCLNIPGAETMVPAILFLKGVNLGQRDGIDGRVVVVGGGGVAFDCALTVKRLGVAEVHIVCVEGQDCMCAAPLEIQKAETEGIVIHNSSMVSRVLDLNGKAAGIEYFEISSFEFDEKCCISVQPVSGAKKRLEADTVISAVGGEPDLAFIGSSHQLEIAPNGTLKVDSQTLLTSMHKVFAAGDVVTGPSTVAQAVGSGRHAALAIDRYLRGSRFSELERVTIGEAGQVVHEAIADKLTPHVVAFDEILNIDYHAKRSRQETNKLAVKDSVHPFKEIDQGFQRDKAVLEAGRCLHCGHCTSCGCCVEDCPGLILSMERQGPKVAYPDECWHCGCCRIACPNGAIFYEFPLNMLV